ncbi:hypothetical protein MYA_4004 [Burkholderia sp. KJ006]|nr:hypothetical protein MYA_4004 [Burkholderia sp. KJ006]
MDEGVKLQNKSDILRQKRNFRPADVGTRPHMRPRIGRRPCAGPSTPDKKLTQIRHLILALRGDPGIIPRFPKSIFRWLGCSLLSRYHREWECPI